MREQITIDARFNGPPDSGNGGYVCGLLGARMPGPAQSTLRVPPPLERPLELVEHDGGLRLLDGETLVAESAPAAVDVSPPATVAPDEAQEAMSGYAGFGTHAFPTCFVCGPEREPGDGLRLFPGPIDGSGLVAALWEPGAELGVDGAVRPEIVWAALDCPSYFGGPVGHLAVLGRLAAALRAPVAVGEPHVVLGWGLGSQGRKHFAAAAVTDAAGAVLAVSQATWIALDPDDRGSVG